VADSAFAERLDTTLDLRELMSGSTRPNFPKASAGIEAKQRGQVPAIKGPIDSAAREPAHETCRQSCLVLPAKLVTRHLWDRMAFELTTSVGLIRSMRLPAKISAPGKLSRSRQRSRRHRSSFSVNGVPVSDHDYSRHHINNRIFAHH
jgi:hypothetical protein